MLQAVLVTTATAELVSLQELKDHLKIDPGVGANTVAQDTLLTACIVSARHKVESITNRKLITQTWDYRLNGWPESDKLKIPFGWLQSITSITYVDSTGGSTTFGSTEYITETNGEQLGNAVLTYDNDWPTEVTLYPSNPITVRFVCGCTAATTVPERLRIATKFEAQNMYEHGGNDKALKELVSSLTADYRIHDEF